MIQPRKNKTVKKALAGAAIASIASTGIGLVTSLIGQNKAKRCLVLIRNSQQPVVVGTIAKKEQIIASTIGFLNHLHKPAIGSV